MKVMYGHYWLCGNILDVKPMKTSNKAGPSKKISDGFVTENITAPSPS